MGLDWVRDARLRSALLASTALVGISLAGAALSTVSTVPAGAAELTWNPNPGNGDWSRTDANWQSGGGPKVVYADRSDVVFGDVAQKTVTVDTAPTGVPLQVRSIDFNATGYAIGGGALGLSRPSAGGGSATVITVAPAGATATISSTLTNGSGAAAAASLVKAGDGTLVLSGGNTYTGATRVTDGRLVSTGTINNVSVAEGATLVTSGSVTGGLGNAGTVLASGAIGNRIVNAGTFTVAGDLVAYDAFFNRGGRLSVTGGNLVGADLAALDNGIDGNSDGPVSFVRVGAGRTLAVNGVILNRAGAAFENNGTVNSNRFTNEGRLVNTDGAAINGRLINAAGRTTNDGTLNGGATVTGGILETSGTINGGLTNAATVLASGTVNGRIRNTGTFTVTGDLVGNDAFFNRDGGRLIVSGGTSFGGLTVLDNGNPGDAARTAFVRVGGDARLAVTGPVLNRAGASFENNGTVETPRFTNEGRFVNKAGAVLDGRLVNGAGRTTNAGTLDGGALVTGGRLESSGLINRGLDQQGGATVNTGTINGGARVSGGLLANAGTVNDGLRQTGGATRNSGRIDDGATVTGGVLETSGTIAGGLTNAATVRASGTIDGRILNRGTGTFTVTGALVGNDAFFNRDSARLIVSTGTSFGGLTVLDNGSAGTVADPNGVRVAAGGSLTVTDKILNRAGASFRNDGAVTSDRFTNAGSLINAGTLTVRRIPLINEGTLVNTGTVEGGLLQAAGSTNNAGTINGAAMVTGGTLDTSGRINGGLLQTGGSTSNSGTITDGVTVGDGTLVTSGRINGGLLQAGGSTSNSGRVNDGATVVGGALTTSGTINGGLDQRGGTVTNAAPGTINDGVLVTGGTLTTSGTINGGLTNSSTVLASGAINGRIVNQGTGTFTVNGALVGNDAFLNRDSARLIVSGGASFTGLTSLTNSSPGVGTDPFGVRIVGGGTLAVAGDVTNTASGTLSNGGTLTANNLGNAGRLTSDGTITVAGTVTNDGILSASGALAAGTFTNNNRFNLAGNLAGAVGTLANNGQFNVAGASTFSGITTFNNSGTVGLFDANTGTNATIGAGTFNNGATGTIDLVNKTATPATNSTLDTLTIAGSYVGSAGSRLAVDANLTGVSGPLTLGDRLTIIGGASGQTIVDVNRVGGQVGFVATPIPVVSVGDGNLALTTGQGFQDSGFVTYGLQRVELAGGGAEYRIVSSLDANRAASATSSIAAMVTSLNVGFFQSISAFISGPAEHRNCDPQLKASKLCTDETSSVGMSNGGKSWSQLNQQAAAAPVAADANDSGILPNTVGFGLWARGSGGETTIRSASVATVPNIGTVNGDNRTRINFAGFQFGADVATFNINNGGFNLHLGVTGGEVYANGKALQNSQATGVFNIPFVGAYAALTSGPFTSDLSYRHDFYNARINDPGSGVTNTKLPIGSDTVAASAAYRFDLPGLFGGEQTYFLEPSASISYTTTQVSNLAVSAGALTFRSIDSILGRFGFRAGTTFLAGDKLALQPFVTASVWNEFAGDAASRFIAQNVSVDPNATVPILTNRVGVFGQFGVGITGQLLGTDLVGYVRGDLRVGERLEGYSINGGVRYPF